MPADHATMISAKGLKRTYKSRNAEVDAVRGVDIEVRKGEIVGFLGPNGAGKTTTIKMLCTLLEPTDGTATVAGIDLRADPRGVRRRIGFVSQAGGTLGEARAGDEIVDQARLYGMDRQSARAKAQALLRTLDLEGIWNRKCSSLSGGQRRRLDIVMGLIHDPALVFLDEPSTGLDPQSRANLWNHIRSLRDELGTTVFLTTHYMDEADNLCDRILVVDHGEIVAEGTPEELKKRISGDAVTLTLSTPDEALRAGEVVASVPGATGLVVEGSSTHLTLPDGGAALPGLLRVLDQNAITATGVEVKRPTLDDVFLTLTGRSLRDAA